MLDLVYHKRNDGDYCIDCRNGYAERLAKSYGLMPFCVVPADKAMPFINAAYNEGMMLKDNSYLQS